jgi:hypothetical protein
VIASVRDRALVGVIYDDCLRVDEATQRTTENVDRKNHRHAAKLLRAYMRVRKDGGSYLFTGRRTFEEADGPATLCGPCREGPHGRAISARAAPFDGRPSPGGGAGIEYVADHLGPKNIQNRVRSAKRLSTGVTICLDPDTLQNVRTLTPEKGLGRPR